MQVNVAGLRRNIKNLAHNYSDAQVKVREATSNDPWGPSATIMAEVADLTYNVVAFSEIMQMIWKRLNDHGKNWRHVYKALILLEYLIKTGTEKVAQQCKENIFAIQTLREFVYFEEGKDQGTHVREKAKQLVNLLKDDERLKAERFKALRAKERFNEFPSGFGSDGYIDGPSHRDMPPGWQEEPKPVSELEMVRPQTAGEEELQLQLAMAMSREEAEQEEAKRRSDDVRLQLALSQSEQDFNGDSRPGQPTKKDEPQSHLLDLLDISLGATSISSPPLGAVGGSGDPWGTPARASSQLSDPWSGTSSPPIDPWQPSAAMRSATASAPLGAVGGVVSGTNGDIWAALRTQSPSVASGSSTEGWLHSNGGGGGGAAPAVAMNGILIGGGAPVDPWLAKTAMAPLAAAPPLLASSNTPADSWLNENARAGAGIGSAAGATAVVSDDPWAPKAANDDPWKTIETVGVKKPSPDMDEFDIITNRNKTGDLLSNNVISGLNNNNASLLDDLDPLSSLNSTMTSNAKKQLNTPQTFLGANSSLVNLDNLIKPIQTQTQSGGNAAYNPFSDTIVPPPKTNLFQQQQPAVPSINQLKQQQPFAMTINQDPWAPAANSNAASQKNLCKDSYLINYDSDELEINSQSNASTTNNNNRNGNKITTTAIINSNSQYQQQHQQQQHQMQYSKSDYDVFNTSHIQNEFYNNIYNNNNNNKHHNNNSNSSNNSFYSSHSVDNIRDMQITTDSYEKLKPNELNFNYFSYSPPNQSTNTTTSTNNNSTSISSLSFTAQFNTINNNSLNNNSNNRYATTIPFTHPAVDASSLSPSPPSQIPPPLPLLTLSASSSFNHIHAGGGYSDAFAASLASTPGIKISPLISSLGNAETSSGGESGGGSLFSYGFYDENAPNALTLGNCKMLDNNNNNNNMPWIKPEATAASSNPFLS